MYSIVSSKTRNKEHKCKERAYIGFGNKTASANGRSAAMVPRKNTDNPQQETIHVVINRTRTNKSRADINNQEWRTKKIRNKWVLYPRDTMGKESKDQMNNHDKRRVHRPGYHRSSVYLSVVFAQRHAAKYRLHTYRRASPNGRSVVTVRQLKGELLAMMDPRSIIASKSHLSCQLVINQSIPPRAEEKSFS